MHGILRFYLGNKLFQLYLIIYSIFVLKQEKNDIYFIVL